MVHALYLHIVFESAKDRLQGLIRYYFHSKVRKVFFNEKIEDLHKLAKALLLYETLSGEEIKDLIFKNIKPKRSEDEDNKNKEEPSSALGSLGLKPKPAV